MNGVDITEPPAQWFVMRDLKRPNAKEPAYKYLANLGFEVFTPLKPQVREVGNRRIREEVPFIHDLLFVHTTKAQLDPIVARTPTLQYRFQKGKAYGTPMTVPTDEMSRFIAAVSSVPTPRYFRLDEITPAMYGANIKMICNGALNCYEGRLLKIKGSGKKRLVVELKGLLVAAVEVSEADYVEVV